MCRVEVTYLYIMYMYLPETYYILIDFRGWPAVFARTCSGKGVRRSFWPLARQALSKLFSGMGSLAQLNRGDFHGIFSNNWIGVTSYGSSMLVNCLKHITNNRDHA